MVGAKVDQLELRRADSSLAGALLPGESSLVFAYILGLQLLFAARVRAGPAVTGLRSDPP